MQDKSSATRVKYAVVVQFRLLMLHIWVSAASDSDLEIEVCTLNHHTVGFLGWCLCYFGGGIYTNQEDFEVPVHHWAGF